MTDKDIKIPKLDLSDILTDQEHPSAPSNYGLEVLTWQSTTDSGHGMRHILDTELFGGNTGHTALALTLPVNAQTTEWIKKYCLEPAIPFEKKKISHKQARMNENGQYNSTINTAFEEDVYVVYFSYWPSKKTQYLEGSMAKDSIDERTGVHQNWTSAADSIFGIEKRVHKGKLGATTMTYGPINTVHQRNNSEEILEQANKTARLAEVNNWLEAFDVLAGKITSKKDILVTKQRIKNKLENKDTLLKQLKKQKHDLKLIQKFIDSKNQSTISIADLDIPIEIFNKMTSIEQKKTDKSARSLMDEIKQQIKDTNAKLDKEIKFFSENNLQQIVQELKRSSKISKSEALILNRLLPNWQQRYNVNNNEISSRECMLLVQDIATAKESMDTEKAKLISELEDFNERKLLPMRYKFQNLDAQRKQAFIAKEYFCKFLDKDSNDFINVFKTEPFQSKLAQLKEQHTAISDAVNFFIRYLDQNDAMFIATSNQCVDIADDLALAIFNFTKITGIDWQTIIDSDDDDNYSTISKKEILEIYKHLKNEHEVLKRKIADLREESNQAKCLPINDSTKKHLEDASKITGIDWKTLVKASPDSPIQSLSINDLAAVHNAIVDKYNALQAEENAIAQSDEYKNEPFELYAALNNYNELNGHLEKLLNESSKKYLKQLNETAKINNYFRRDLTAALATIPKEQLEKFALPENLAKANTISKQQAINLQKLLKEQYIITQGKLVEAIPARPASESEGFYEALTQGRTPNKIHLPLDNSIAMGNEYGLEPEAMLQEMQKIISEGKSFDLNVRNCSNMANRVLQAGSKNEHLRAQFQNQELGAVDTPQTVLDSCHKFTKALKTPNDSKVKQLKRFKPLQKAFNSQTTKLLCKHSTTKQKVAAGTALVFLHILKSPVSLVSALLRPSKSINALSRFINYAFSKPSHGLRAFSLLIGIPAIIVLAPLSGIENVLTAPFKLIKHLARNTKVVKNQLIDLNPRKKKTVVDRDQLLSEAMTKNIKTVDNKNIVEAICEFNRLLAEGDIIPVLSDKTADRIEKYISKQKSTTVKQGLLDKYQSLQQKQLEKISAVSKDIFLKLKSGN